MTGNILLCYKVAVLSRRYNHTFYQSFGSIIAMLNKSLFTFTLLFPSGDNYHCRSIVIRMCVISKSKLSVSSIRLSGGFFGKYVIDVPMYLALNDELAYESK